MSILSLYSLNNIIYICSSNPFVAVIFTTNTYKNKEDVYNDNNTIYELWKNYLLSDINISYIKGTPCFLSLFPEIKCLFVSYVNVYINISINSKIK